MNNHQNPGAVYNDRIDSFGKRLEVLKKRDMIFGIIKLSWVAIATLSIFSFFTKNKIFNVWVFCACVLLFIVTALFHEIALKKIKRFKTLNSINEDELKILRYEFPDRFDTGAEFKNPDHNYLSDLDIFGAKSFFHFVNRAVTSVGRQCLANWMQVPADAGEIKMRQAAVDELSGKIDWRQEIIFHGIFIGDSSKKLNSLYAFLEEPFFVLDKKFLRVFLYLWPFFTLLALGSIAFGISFIVFFFFFSLQLGVNTYFLKSASLLYKSTDKSCKVLKAYSRIISEIEKENFSSPKLNGLKSRLFVNEKTASLCIRKFSTLLEWFDTRRSMFHFIINNIIFLDLHCIYRIEKWRKETAAHVKDWFNVIGEVEALSSLATLRFNNPEWVMPEVDEGHFHIEASSTGHPLIHEDERICNDISFGAGGKGSMAIITGPNMAGKSTFLRTIGVNIVSALAGAPVCAKRFGVSPIKLFTSMQTSDSLDKHLSLFYAELQRLKMIIDGINRKEPVFFLIDEMLKGTNALDRQKGAIALLRQLIQSRSNGITATHDLELTKLDSQGEWKKAGEVFPEEIQIVNYHFDGYIEDDRLLFDYKLKNGICESFNALVLMKKMGIHLTLLE